MFMYGIYLIFLALGAVHVYWGLGGLWPGRDSRSLADFVIGREPMPGPRACIVVAAVLVLGPLLAPGPMALGLLLRGAGGYVDHLLRPEIVGSRYEKLNRILYSPLCLLLALGLLQA